MVLVPHHPSQEPVKSKKQSHLADQKLTEDRRMSPGESRTTQAQAKLSNHRTVSKINGGCSEQ